MKYLIIIDVQNDFVTGSLGTKEAQQMLPGLLKKAREFPGKILMTKDTHEENYLDTQEGKLLPVLHCMKNTEGWEFPAEMEKIRLEKAAEVYEKPCFGSLRLVEEIRRLYEKGEIESAELVGICTDICVASNALMLKSSLPELPIYVDAACCAGVDPRKHEAALEVMESCQIIVRR
ncbi:MAG TPA: cysteine hydrolase [Candidatus Blautia faecipullorum]|nr:cysteine hydrolase [Candidatus Blautia faecipullorum]